MNMIPVNSSNLRAVGYNDSTQELTIEFNNGVYTYSGIPASVHKGLMDAPSKGSYVHRFIKSYPMRKGY